MTIPEPHTGIIPTTTITTIIHTSRRGTGCFSGIITPHITHLDGVFTMIPSSYTKHTMIHSGMIGTMHGIRGIIRDIHLMYITAGLPGDIGITVITAGTQAITCHRGARGAIHDIIRSIPSGIERVHRVHSVPPAVTLAIHEIPVVLAYVYRQQAGLLTADQVLQEDVMPKAGLVQLSGELIEDGAPKPAGPIHEYAVGIHSGDARVPYGNRPEHEPLIAHEKVRHEIQAAAGIAGRKQPVHEIPGAAINPGKHRLGNAPATIQVLNHEQ